MIRISNTPLRIPAGLTIVQSNQGKHLAVVIKGETIEREYKFNSLISLDIDTDKSCVEVKWNGSPSLRKQHITTVQSVLLGIFTGFTQPFTRTLSLKGVGYEACVIKQDGKDVLRLTVGYCAPQFLPIPQYVSVNCPSPIKVVISCPFKDLVGFFASKVHTVRRPNSYQGIGIAYAHRPVVLKTIKKK